jgi:hypothetical protein
VDDKAEDVKGTANTERSRCADFGTFKGIDRSVWAAIGEMMNQPCSSEPGAIGTIVLFGIDWKR